MRYFLIYAGIMYDTATKSYLHKFFKVTLSLSAPLESYGSVKNSTFVALPTLPKMVSDPRIGEVYQIVLNDGDAFMLRRLTNLWPNKQDIATFRKSYKSHEELSTTNLIAFCSDCKVF